MSAFPGLRGVIATGRTLETCRTTLQEAVEEWILVRVARGLDVPALGKLKIRVRKAVDAGREASTASRKPIAALRRAGSPAHTRGRQT